jgi:hypothetical protein
MDGIERYGNGIDGATGDYLETPSPTELAQAIASSPTDAVEAAQLRYRSQEPDFGPVHTVNASDLSDAGWALIAARDTPSDILLALNDLRELRRVQAGPRYREFLGDDGFLPGDTKRTFFRRHRVSVSMPPNPDRMPYYLLLVGDPEQIPFAFQYQLGLQYAVGRITFERVSDYAEYARNVVAAEARVGQATLGWFAPSNADDYVTEQSATKLVTPLADRLSHDRHANLVATGADAIKDRLIDLLCRDEPASIVFTASHGVRFDSGHPRQRLTQGALICQDWPGPVAWKKRPLDPAFYFSGEDIGRLSTPPTARLVFSFACYGAGTPILDEYSARTGRAAQPIAESPFVAGLPQRLLARRDGATVAFVGHVERVWTTSFLGDDDRPELDVFTSAFQAILEGQRLGHAMDYFRSWYARLGAELSDMLDGIRHSGDPIDEESLSRLWTETNDARSYVVIGDPAVCGR